MAHESVPTALEQRSLIAGANYDEFPCCATILIP